jgi:hypothetical protein
LFVDNGKYGGYYKLLKTKINLQMQTIFMNWISTKLQFISLL